jgi:hypothetical protein
MSLGVLLAFGSAGALWGVGGLCTEELSVVIEMAGSRSIHAVVSAGEGMAILVVALAFLAVAALGLVTALTIVKELQRRKLVQRKRIQGAL